MAKRTNLLAGLLAIGATVGITLPSNAQVNFSDIDTLVNMWLQGRSTIDLVPSQATVRANLETRRAQLEAQINSEVSAGRLTATEAANLRAELASVTAQLNDAVYSGGGLTISEARDTLFALRTLNSHVQDAVRNSDIASGGSTTLPGYGYGYGWGNRNNSDVMNRIESLRTRINTAQIAGQLRRNQANRLNSSLNWIRARYYSMRRGGLSPSELSQLNSYLTSLDTRVTSMTTIASGVNVDLRPDITRLRNRIDDAVASGRLSWSRANRMYRDLNSIASLEIQYRRSGNLLTQSEVNALRNRLAGIESAVNTYM